MDRPRHLGLRYSRSPQGGIMSNHTNNHDKPHGYSIKSHDVQDKLFRFRRKRFNVKKQLSDLRELNMLEGQRIFSLPRQYWSAGCIFSGFSDKGFSRRTAGVFPVVIRTTHPIYILKSDEYGELVCPCTTRVQTCNAGIIPKGTVLEFTGHVTECDSYTLYALRFFLSADECIYENLMFRGIVNPDNIKILGSTPEKNEQ